MRRTVSKGTAAVGAVLLALVVVGTVTAASRFVNTEPDAAKQWYFDVDNAWTFWAAQPQLATVKVAVIDSGIDAAHPEFTGRIAAGKSFVGTPWDVDTDGHGTFVAGEIAANASNGAGIAGMAFNAQLLIAKVVQPDGTIPLRSEIDAIHWAVDNGARVINLSLGAARDPLNARLDSYSSLEQAAVEYAYAKGAVVVAAVGNGPQSPATPWPFAGYPAALPHVLGVSAIRRDGSVPAYSNRDAVYNDLAAPGDGIFSTIPRSLESTDAGCATEPYSDCSKLEEFKDAIGTSFAAPQVAAAAALLLGQNPQLTPDQVTWLLERTATDEGPATGCLMCGGGRDRFTGWGRLNVAAALTRLTGGLRLPQPDAWEPNDDAGPWSHALPPLPRTISATLDYWDDDVDVYRVHLNRGQRLYVRLTPGAASANVELSLWKPGTAHVLPPHAKATDRLVVGTAAHHQLRIGYRARVSGTFYVEARLDSQNLNPVSYKLALAR
ncbi:MAG TPA: S8 family serine peptidase [Gaiellaceae bacterium]